MKRTLKTVSMCCLVTVIGILIGSSGKTMLKGTFSNVNSSPEKVIEAYLNAYYSVDSDVMEQCLSPDLNNLKMLEYFGGRGSLLARRLITGYNEYLYYKQNPPEEDGEEGEKELYQLFKETEKNIEQHGIVRAYTKNKIKGIEDDNEYLEEYAGKRHIGTVVDIKSMEIESDIEKDPSYIDVGILITLSNHGEQDYDDRGVVLQKIKNKYYIVDI